MQSKKSLIIGLVVVAVLAVGYFVGLPMWQKQQIAKIQEALGKIPGASVESIEPSGFGKDFVLKNLRIRFEIEPGLFLESATEKIEIKGLNLGSFYKDSKEVLFDAVTFIKSSNTLVEDFGETTGQNRLQPLLSYAFDSLAINSLTMNVPAMRKGIESGDMEAVVAALDYHIAKSAASNEVISFYDTYAEGSVFSIEIAKSSAENTTPLTSGAFAAEGLVAKNAGKPVATMSKVGMKAFALPDFLNISSATDENEAIKMLVEAFRQSPFKIEDLRVTDLTVMREGQASVTMASAGLSIIYNDPDGKILFDIKDLTLPQGIFSQNVGENPQVIPDKQLIVNANFDDAIKRENRTFIITTNPSSLLVENFGDLLLSQQYSFTLEGDIPFMWLLNVTSGSKLHNFEMEIKDKGAREMLAALELENIKAFGYEENPPATTGEILTRFAEEIRNDSSINDIAILKNAFMAFADFIEKGGSFKVSVQPEKPVSMQLIDRIAVETPEMLNVKVTHTPAQ